ncbi:Cof-type HAD-IIB family hydrolase [Streptococcus caprae]|uniref:Cof-type HAD-IIB family hydrolase n=1 Tax=Streptococcus caprae TaxID=1640501 RepID=A0ABV8CU43_9STRE
MSKMIFSDIDGTLITSELIISEKTQQAIRRRVQAGDWFVPISARMPEAIHPILDGLALAYPLVSFNGALVQDHEGKVLFSHPFSADLAHDICVYIEGEWQSIAWNAYSYGHWYSQNRENYWVNREEEVVGLESRTLALSDLPKIKEVHKLLIMGEPSEIDQLEQVLVERYPALSIAKSFPSYIEIMAQGIDKGQAVGLLADHYGIPIEETLAFGDNFNDLPMLLAVGQGYAMGNAPEAVKAQVGLVTADHNHNGIAQVLEKLS